jgi:hypothetical protein
MAGFVASGATFTFVGPGANITAIVTRLSVETPTAEIVDMTAFNAPANQMVLVPTGAWQGGAIDVDFLYAPNGADPQTVIGKYGTAQFSSPQLSVSRNCILESASFEAAVGDLVRGTLRLRLTDYVG